MVMSGTTTPRRLDQTAEFLRYHGALGPVFGHAVEVPFPEPCFQRGPFRSSPIICVRHATHP